MKKLKTILFIPAMSVLSLYTTNAQIGHPFCGVKEQTST
jgi:hypothetical protein